MKILLAGGAGYIGSVLAPALIDHNYDVEVIDALWFGCHLPKEVKVIDKELFECKKEDFDGYDQVIFLAGLSNDPMAEFNPAKNFVDNGALPSYLAYKAKKAGVKRFIYASSCSVYGYTVDRLYDEESPTVSNYPYGISKLQGERGVLQMQDESFSVIAVRQGTISGFSPRMRFDLIVNTMFKTAVVEKKIMVSNPSIWRPVYDIRDAADAFVRAVQANYSINGVFNATSDNYTVGQVADLVKYEVEKKTGDKIKLDIKNIQDFRNYKVSINKAKTYLGFQPLYTIKDIIDNLFDHMDSFGDFEKDEFYNIRTFKKLQF
ncbi:MAG TPA: NAD(P)-dependent oxidoreductase [Smithellaceae bacterium]|nr:NAD(P)-dependent oxidoreductase [Smithellaceae bacterium]HPL65355.1 NAD(P)-dependent oxidoreductase [Smithellaceae bacterium]